MQKLNIPDIETSDSKLQLGDKKTNEIVSQVVDQILPQASHEDKIDGEFLTLCLDNEIGRRKEENPSYNEAFFTHSLSHRPFVFVAEKHHNGRLEWVTTSEQVRKLFKAFDPRKIQKDAHPDKNMLLLRARLPEGYVARVAYIQVKHVPRVFFRDDKVVIKKMPKSMDKGVLGEIVILCRELLPVWTSARLFEIPQKEIFNHYGWVSMKVSKEDYTLRGWFPGVDVTSSREVKECGDHFVLVGPHKEAVASAQAAKQEETHTQGGVSLQEMSTE
jgi:hypothetical protein